MRPFVKRLFFLLVAGLMLSSLSCSGTDRPAPRYIFLITLDTTRADFINYAGQNNDLTPNFARLAAKGVRFENAYTVIPITLPSHAAMMYSLYPHELKVYNNGDTNRTESPSLAQLLHQRGYHTAAAVSLGVLRAEAGLNHGFDTYLENFRPGLWYRPAAEVNADAERIVRGLRGRKSFIWLHYQDPHGPYFTPEYSQRFRAVFNGAEVFSCRSTDQYLVDLDLDLRPGENILELNAEIPHRTRSGAEIQVRNVAFMNFEVSGLGADGTMKVPADWNGVNQRRERLTYFTKAGHSRVVFHNPGAKIRRIHLAFLLKLHLDPASTPALYREEIVYMDREFGHLLDFLEKEGILEESAFLVMGDHGEGLGEIHDNHVGHIHYLNRVYTHVPLFLAGSGISGPRVRRELVSNLNVAPTLLDLAGIPAAKHMRGTSLLRKELPSHRLMQATYTPEAYSDAFSMVEFPSQLIFTPGNPAGRRMELFDLQKDALGERNLFKDPSTDPRRKADLVNRVRKLAQVILAGKSASGEYSPRQKEILKSLGYL